MKILNEFQSIINRRGIALLLILSIWIGGCATTRPNEIQRTAIFERAHKQEANPGQCLGPTFQCIIQPILSLYMLPFELILAPITVPVAHFQLGMAKCAFRDSSVIYTFSYKTQNECIEARLKHDYGADWWDLNISPGVLGDLLAAAEVSPVSKDNEKSIPTPLMPYVADDQKGGRRNRVLYDMRAGVTAFDIGAFNQSHVVLHDAYEQIETIYANSPSRMLKKPYKT